LLQWFTILSDLMAVWYPFKWCKSVELRTECLIDSIHDTNFKIFGPNIAKVMMILR